MNELNAVNEVIKFIQDIRQEFRKNGRLSLVYFNNTIIKENNI